MSFEPPITQLWLTLKELNLFSLVLHAALALSTGPVTKEAWNARNDPLRLYGTYSYFISIDAISLLPCIAGLVLLVGGRAAWR